MRTELMRRWIWLVFLFCFSTFSQAAVELAVEVNPNPAQRGKTVNVAITVTNSGNSTTDLVTLRMQWVGSFLNNLSDSLISDGGSCLGTCAGTEFVTWTLGAMNPGETRTVTLPPSIWVGTPLGTQIPFMAEVFEGGVKQGEQTEIVVAQASSPLTITVDEDVNPVSPGEDIVYTITYSNQGATSATQASLSFPIPTGTTFVSASDGVTPTGGVVSWNLGTVSVDSGSEKKVRVTVNNNLSQGSILEVNSAEITGLMFSLPETSTAMAVTRVEDNGLLLLSIEQNPDPVTPGQVLNTALTVTNVSGAPVSGVILWMRWTGETQDNLNNSLISGGGGCAGTCSGKKFVIWTLGTLNIGETQTFTLPISIWVGVPTGALLTFNAYVTEDGRKLVEQSHTVRAQTAPPFNIAVDEDVNPVKPGEGVTYTIMYSNQGATSATQSSLSFPIPAGTTFVSATDGIIPSDGVLTWALGTVSADSGSEKKVKVTVDNSVPQGSILEVDAAEITGLVNSLPKTSSAMVSTRVENNDLLQLAMEQNPDPVKPGEILDTALTVTNISGGPLSGVILKLRWKGSVLNNLSDSLISDGGSCLGTCAGNEFVTWTLGTMNAGEKRTVMLPISVWVGTATGKLLTFNSVVTEDGGKLIEQSHTVRAQTTPYLSIAIDEDVNPVGLGEYLIYTITYSNRGVANTTQTKLSFPIPMGTSFVSATDGVMPSNGVVSWNLGTVGIQTGGEKKVRLIVHNGLPAGSLIKVDAAEITGLVNSLPKTSSATGVTHIDNNSLLLLGLSQTPDPILPGQTLPTELTVSNISADQLPGTILRIRWMGSFLDNLSDSLLSDGGSCLGTCAGNEFVTWALGTLQPNDIKTVTLPPVVWVGTPVGKLLTFNSVVTWDGLTQSHSSNTIFVGTNFTAVANPPEGIDTDDDTIIDAIDNCTLSANTSQLDSDGDGIGNQCDCDLNQDDFCGGPDFTLFIGCFNKSTSGNPSCEAADMNGDGFVGGPDFTLFIGGFNNAPGPSAAH